MKTYQYMSLIFMVLIFGMACSSEGGLVQDKREINKAQLQTRGDGLCYAVNEEKPYNGRVVELFSNGQKSAEVTYKNGRLHGMSTAWYSDGQKKVEVSYKEGEQSGPCGTWYPNGQKEKEGLYQSGKEAGKWTYWNEDGQKRRECTYKEGVLDGPWMSWYNNGQKEKEGLYQSGKEAGKWTYWYKNGQKRRECTYKEGVLDGPWMSWYDNGQKEKEGSYQSGKEAGKWDFWFKDGVKLETGAMTGNDGKTYKTVKIGGQWWMSENLRETKYRNGDAIPEVTDNSQWGNLNTGARCSYGNEESNATTYGYLYNWYAAVDRRNIAPAGWRVPTDADWTALTNYLGSHSGGKMKATGTPHWQRPNEGATNASRFSALPGGYRFYGGDFGYLGITAYFWSATEYDTDGAWGRHLDCSASDVYRSSRDKQNGFSVRLVRE